MGEKISKTAKMTRKEIWAEPKVEWVKPQLVRLDDRDAKGKGLPSVGEFIGPYGSYGPS